MFSIGCAVAGFGRVVLVDDFSDDINLKVGDGVLQLHRSYGVEIASRDIVKCGMEGLPDSLDVVTCFDSMEHWHHSPKSLFHEVYDRLTPGGVFLLAVPNNTSLRKRITVPLGYGRWSEMDDWYEAPRFRGHVREPNVADLRYIAADMGLVDVRILGRNWWGNGVTGRVVRLVDAPLRLFPSLCSTIYVSGKKGERSSRE
jgi:SAM-dependent methyltransferase